MLKLPLIQAAIRQKQKEYALECRRYAPIDVMLANLDYWFTKAQQRAAPSIDEDGSTVDDGAKDAEMARRMAQEVARDAAPYIHPRLQAIAVASVGRKSIDEYTDDELAAIAAVAPEPADGSSGDGTSENQSKDAGTQQPA
jgi:hypothetical protein